MAKGAQDQGCKDGGYSDYVTGSNHASSSEILPCLGAAWGAQLLRRYSLQLAEEYKSLSVDLTIEARLGEDTSPPLGLGALAGSGSTAVGFLGDHQVGEI